ncbi:GLPGLI family protein [Gelidibacter salicanalis]|uniref:GLPGLI family protein n=2 Tax=Gelidibacter salicanalis TaxID=291193 RepID=A0A934NKF4_9FLAO|nr:GLPGLI family protein [Gelidibacter salicanalis]
MKCTQKVTQKVLVVAALFMVLLMNAQDFQGVATYKSHRKVDFKVKEGNENKEVQKQIQEQLKRQFQQEYTLTFNKNESLYKKNEKLEAPMPSSSGIKITISDGSDIIYKNIKEQRFTNQTEIYGKQFLVKDSLAGKTWELLNETKNIGQYTCFKAQFKAEVKTQTLTEDNGMETITKEVITTAWYTPQVPISNGPARFFGLPGLILEINDGDLTLVCTKIVINPAEEIAIVEPKKGKEVTQQEFNEILEKKNNEMMDQMNSRSKNGNTVIFSSGG